MCTVCVSLLILLNVVLSLERIRVYATIINTLIGTAVVLFTDSYIGDLRREFDTQPNTHAVLRIRAIVPRN